VKYQKQSEVTTMERLAQINSAILLQRVYRRWKKKKERRLSIGIEEAIEQTRPGLSPHSMSAERQGRSVSVMHRHTRTNHTIQEVNDRLHRSMTDFADIDDDKKNLSSPAPNVSNRFSRHGVMMEPQLSKSETLHEQPGRQSRTKSRSRSRASLFNSPNRVSPIGMVDTRDNPETEGWKSPTEQRVVDLEQVDGNASPPSPVSRQLSVTPTHTSPVNSPVWNTETSDYDSFSLESKKSSSRDSEIVEPRKVDGGRPANLKHVSENPSFQSSIDDQNSTSSGISSRSVEVLPDITM